jgi:hypothetical protein
MTALPRRRRNRTLAMIGATLLVAASVPVLGYVGVKAVLDSTGGRDATADNLPVQSFPATPSALYVTTDDEGTLSSASVFVLAPGGVGGSIVSVPVNADVGLASNARQSLQQVYAAGGIDALTPEVESLLMISIDDAAEADPEQLAAFLAPYGPFTVELTADVPRDTGDSPLSAGTAVLQVDNAVRVLTAGADGVDQTERQGNIDAVWAGVVGSVGAGRPLAGSLEAPPATFDELVARLFAGQTQSRGLTAAPLAGAENPDDLDVVEVDRSEAVLVFASIAPGSMSPAALGPVIRLEAPPGYDLQVKRTIDKLLFLNANVVSVDTTAAPQADTVFYVPDESNRALVTSTDDIFGEINFGTPTMRIDGVDVTIALGTDYLESLAT